MFSLVTNACASDAARLRLVVPSWQKTFGSRFDELVIVLDTEPPSGRIASLHGRVPAAGLAEVRDVLRELAGADPRIRIEELPGPEGLAETARRWFTYGEPLRCQAGTPILAFVRAFDSATRNRIVLRADCDMLFHEVGWLDEAQRLLTAAEADLVQPAGVGEGAEASAVSTRALLLDGERFAERCLPMRPARLDALRVVHRWWQGRPPWLALEQMFAREVEAGRIRHRVLPAGLGSSMHVSTRDEAALPGMDAVAVAFGSGEIPAAQIRAGQNFERAAWKAIL